jgi:hypothetical protein
MSKKNNHPCTITFTVQKNYDAATSIYLTPKHTSYHVPFISLA